MVLAELLTQHEGKSLEFKRDDSSPEGIVRTVVAFANGAGGTLVVGVEDRTRRVRGVSEPTRVEERLANLVSDRVEPRLVPDLQILPWRNTQVVAVRVFPSSTRPHYLKAEGEEIGVYVRVGSTNRRADPAQIDEIKRLVRGRTFDEEPLPELGAQAIDFEAARACFAPIRRLRAGDLRTLQMSTLHQNREVPTAGGVLLFGRDRRAQFPDAFLRAGRFAGTDRTTIVDSADITSHLPLVVEEALSFVKRNMQRAIAIRAARHAETWEYPLVALREAITNALVHADYAQRGSPLRLAIFSDRVEIDNPGGLPPGLTLEDIRQGVSKLRNRVVGRVFHALGFIEQWGSGIQRMAQACRQAGLPEPVFEEIGSGFRVTLRREAVSRPELDTLDQRVLDFVRRSSGASTSQIAAQIHRTPRATRDRVSRLVGLGLLVALGTGPRDPRRVFRVVEPAGRSGG
jgi:predicted HTH transcriptional regulator